ncbi:protein SENSITIVE TO UV 2 isoform X2 [Solanum dulcamara]|uniref:protein SENSITIVE TO UV 2 isoform X2 n=1 Tax=Solanum dulcamara TaxID=45834 RepID=UPI002485E63E|nr:protein SENSITIVE TO UV 2 isoform X2 [Solanum dulcamara]
MADEGFDEEWDADFVDQLVQAEEQALSIATQKSLPPPPPPPQQRQSYPAVSYVGVSYSPPRDLSQRVPEFPKGFNQSSDVDIFSAAAGRSSLPAGGSHNAKEEEIDSLKRELDRISEQRNRLEQECIKLRKGRDKKEKRLKFTPPKIVNLNTDSGINIQGDQIKSPEFQNTRSMNEHIGSSTKIGTLSSKDVGIQTERPDESISLSAESNLSDTFCRRNKLLDAWNSSSGQRLGRLLISKLYATCEVDFRVLSGYLNASLPLRTSMESSISLKDNLQYTHSGESAKVSHLFSVLTKVSIIHRSLHILQEVLIFTFNMERKFGKRDNIVVGGAVCWKNASELYEFGYPGNRGLPHVHAEKIFDQDHADGLRLDTLESCTRIGFINYGSSCLISSCFNYIPLFELMCEIVMIHDIEHVRLEAVSVMNLIVARSNAYLERDKYGTDILFQSIVKLLKKGARLHVKKKAVRLLHMLLNCPRVMASFCSCFMEGDGSGVVDTNSNKSSTFAVISMIFESLAECITCTGSNAEELQLRRHTIILLAFFASSGKCGVEILLNYGLPKGKDFPAIILQSLVCDLDLEESDTAQQPEVFKERTLLIREVLILLNRLVSHPKYSSHALRALTNNREKATLTVDVTSRLSSKRTFFWQDVSMTRQIRESEIIDLAQVLRRRVFTFLGGSNQ